MFPTVRPGFHHVLLMILAAVVLILPAACGSGSEGEVRGQVERFVRALYDGDEEALRQSAPAIAGKGSQVRSRLYSTIRGYPDWTVEELQVEDGRAEAEVLFSREGKSLKMELTLRKEDQSWLVQEEIRLSTQIDFVPLEQ